MGIKYRVPGTSPGVSYESPVALLPLGYLSALGGVGIRKAKNWLGHTRDNVTEWGYVTVNPELRELRGLAEKAGGRLMVGRGGFVSVSVPYTGTGSPEFRGLEELKTMGSSSIENMAKDPEGFRAHARDVSNVYQRLQGAMKGLGYEPKVVSEGVFMVHPLFFKDMAYHTWGNIANAHNRSVGSIEIDDREVRLSSYGQEGRNLVPAFKSALQQLMGIPI